MKLKLFIAFIALVVLSGTALAAAPGTPHQFYGSVTTNGHAAVDGLLITAQIEGEDVSATVTKDGYYGLSPDIFYVTDPQTSVSPAEPPRSGKTIEFFVNGVKAADYVFENGASTSLDLSVEGDFPALPSDDDSDDGGSPLLLKGGGSPLLLKGGGTPPPAPSANETNETDETIEVVLEDEEEIVVATTGCTPNWYCSDWLDCVNNKEKRVCTDSNSCGTDEDKPATERACETVQEGEELTPLQSFWQSLFGTGPTGSAVASTGSGSLIAVIVVVAIIAVVLIYAFTRRKGK